MCGSGSGHHVRRNGKNISRAELYLQKAGCGQSRLESIGILPLNLPFSKVRDMPLCFYKRPVLAYRKEIQRNFAFMKKDIQLWFAEQQEWCCGAPSPGRPSASPNQATIAFNCACEHLGFILIYIVLLLTRCVLRDQKSLGRLF